MSCVARRMQRDSCHGLLAVGCAGIGLNVGPRVLASVSPDVAAPCGDSVVQPSPGDIERPMDYDRGVALERFVRGTFVADDERLTAFDGEFDPHMNGPARSVVPVGHLDEHAARHDAVMELLQPGEPLSDARLDGV